MKGLLVKDFRLLKNQVQSFAIIGFIGLMFIFTSQNLNFAISYMAVMSAVFTVNTITYDQYDKGMAYLFTLPINRTKYVKEKYILGILLVVLAMAVMSAIAVIAYGVRYISFEWGDMAATLAGSLFSAVLLHCIMIPIQLKFGAERSQIAISIFLGGVFIILFTTVKIEKSFHVNFSSLFNRIVESNEGVVAGILCVTGIVAILLSYFISLRIMKGKEF